MSAETENPIELKLTVMEQTILNITNEIIKKNLKNYENEQQLANSIKNEMDKTSGSFGWNVVIGKYFGSSIFHKSKCFSLYKIRDLQILIWRT